MMKTDSKAYYRLNNAISQCKRTVVEHRLGRHLSCVLVREFTVNVNSRRFTIQCLCTSENGQRKKFEHLDVLAYSRFSAYVRLEMKSSIFQITYQSNLLAL